MPSVAQTSYLKLVGYITTNITPTRSIECAKITKIELINIKDKISVYMTDQKSGYSKKAFDNIEII